MFEIDITREFSAAHYLRGYQGDCSALHGHNWTVQAIVKSPTLDEIGIALDFRKLKAELDDILDEFDHTNVSDHEAFTELNPTSEVLAMVIYEKLSERLNDGCIKVDRVRVCESPGSGATYYTD
jgi:6-pyruvoyltetrahydropterin/6-carboxytetrahydropterin synthase